MVVVVVTVMVVVMLVVVTAVVVVVVIVVVMPRARQGRGQVPKLLDFQARCFVGSVLNVQSNSSFD